MFERFLTDVLMVIRETAIQAFNGLIVEPCRNLFVQRPANQHGMIGRHSSLSDVSEFDREQLDNPISDRIADIRDTMRVMRDIMHGREFVDADEILPLYNLNLRLQCISAIDEAHNVFNTFRDDERFSNLVHRASTQNTLRKDAIDNACDKLERAVQSFEDLHIVIIPVEFNSNHLKASLMKIEKALDRLDSALLKLQTILK